MPRLMSEAAYVRKGGGLCPGCRCTDIEGGPIEVDGDSAIQEITCSSCGAEWTDQYKLSGFSLTNQPDAPVGKDEPDQ